MSTAAPEAIYIYGVVSDDGSGGLGPGIGGAPVCEVVGDGLAALVSHVTEEEIVLGREAMSMHARVLEHAAQYGTVLPMRFGVVMEGEAAVKRRVLDAHHDELAQQLGELEGKVEVRLRATYEEETLMREVIREDQEIAQIRRSLRRVSEDATYYDRIRLGELVAAAVERKRAADTAAIFEATAPLALDTRVAQSAHEWMAFDGSFLVARGRLPEFDAKIEAVGETQAGRMRLKYTGPLPPYSFVELAKEV
ncbi:MAG TPA: GvpL/GvpF family gas vesicle protein [Solirubrobacteraceae bacterium]|nr:GvpL/GvpF family gas vesicle protein [Solirubrobacteraceae bacterium]